MKVLKILKIITKLRWFIGRYKITPGINFYPFNLTIMSDQICWKNSIKIISIKINQIDTAHTLNCCRCKNAATFSLCLFACIPFYFFYFEASHLSIGHPSESSGVSKCLWYISIIVLNGLWYWANTTVQFVQLDSFVQHHFPFFCDGWSIHACGCVFT